MTHVRTQIRHAVKDVLTPALVGYKVFASRRNRINASELPMADIRFLNENSEFDTMGSTYRRNASLYIRVAIADQDADVDDTLDVACVLVEEAMEAAFRDDQPLGALLTEYSLMQTNFTDDDGGDTVSAQVIIRYDVVYRVDASDVENART